MDLRKKACPNECCKTHRKKRNIIQRLTIVVNAVQNERTEKKKQLMWRKKELKLQVLL